MPLKSNNVFPLSNALYDSKRVDFFQKAIVSTSDSINASQLGGPFIFCFFCFTMGLFGKPITRWAGSQSRCSLAACSA